MNTTFSKLLTWPLLTVATLLLASCEKEKKSQNVSEAPSEKPEKIFYWQGHRGARGLMPENTIPAFKKAVDLGMNTMELDVVISKDRQVVVSHEPFMSHEICLDTLQEAIPEDKELAFNIYGMDYATIAQFDCGSVPHDRFPEQAKISVSKPLLKDVYREIEAYVASKGKEQVFYNVEIKSTPDGDGLFHPGPEEFSRLVMEVIEDSGAKERTFIQSFDVRPLQVLQEKYPEVSLVYLIGNEETPTKNLEKLGFVPKVYSPYFKLVNADLAAFCEEKNMQLIPWTVNEVEDMKQMLSLDVDGIITDYPDRVEGVRK